MKNIKIGYELTSGYFFNCRFICNIYRENWKFQNTLDHCSLCYTEDLRDEFFCQIHQSTKFQNIIICKIFLSTSFSFFIEIITF
jgi:hypothetical protein